jgi:hypothetical protein
MNIAHARHVLAHLEKQAASQKDPDTLEIVIDYSGTKVWINVDGECVGRWYHVKRLEIDDRRPPFSGDMK